MGNLLATLREYGELAQMLGRAWGIVVFVLATEALTIMEVQRRKRGYSRLLGIFWLPGWLLSFLPEVAAERRSPPDLFTQISGDVSPEVTNAPGVYNLPLDTSPGDDVTQLPVRPPKPGKAEPVQTTPVKPRQEQRSEQTYPQFKLLICKGPMIGVEFVSNFSAQKREITIGRDSNNDFVIDDKHVSRKHLLIRVEGDDFRMIEVEDVTHKATLRRGNGVTANPANVILKENDIICVGSSELEFHRLV